MRNHNYTACVVKTCDITYEARVLRCIKILIENGFLVKTISAKLTLPAAKVFGNQYSPFINCMEVHNIFRGKRGIFFKLASILLSSLKYINYISRTNSSLFVAHSFESLFLIYILHLVDKPTIIYDSNELEYGRNTGGKYLSSVRNKFVRIVEKIILNKIDYVIAADESRAKDMETCHSIKNVITIRNVAEYSTLNKPNSFNKLIAYSKTDRIILMQGAYDYQSIQNALKALALAEINCSILFLMRDAVKNNTNVLKIARATGFNGNVFVSSNVPNIDLIPFISNCHLSLVLIRNTSKSYYLATPCRLYDSLMAGLPIIASNFPENRILFSKYKVGYLVDPDDLIQIAKCIKYVLQDRDKEIYFKANSRLAALEKYNWSIESKKYTKILQSLLSR